MNVGASHVNDIKKLKTDVVTLEAGVYAATETVVALGVTTDLTAVPASFVALADVQTYLVTLRLDSETRLDAIEAKLDALILALQTSNILL